MRQDASAMEQASVERREEAKHYVEKYKEANDVLKLRNLEKALLQQEKQEQEKLKEALEQ